MSGNTICVAHELDLRETISCFQNLSACMKYRRVCVEKAGQRLALAVPDRLNVKLEADDDAGGHHRVLFSLSWSKQAQESDSVEALRCLAGLRTAAEEAVPGAASTARQTPQHR